jgi:hypothetical protein
MSKWHSNRVYPRLGTVYSKSLPPMPAYRGSRPELTRTMSIAAAPTGHDRQSPGSQEIARQQHLRTSALPWTLNAVRHRILLPAAGG